MTLVADLESRVAEALRDVGVRDPNVKIEHPADLANGDYATGVALQYAKELGMNPKVLAEKIIESLGNIPGVSKVEAAGPGFINFYADSVAVSDAIKTATEADMWGANTLNAGKKIMVEYTDPNPFKEFHVGHLMSNAIGESTARLLEFSGAEVKRANYQGDVGPHVAKAIWALQRDGADSLDAKRLGTAYAEGARMYETDPEIKKEIDILNRTIYERSDERVNALYDVGRKTSLQHFEELYRVLGTNFDYYFFESETAEKGIAIVRGAKVFDESDGAIVYKGEKVGLHTRVFITSNGLPTYETKELGLAEMKEEKWLSDISITVTGNEQKEYFQVVLAALKEINPAIAAKIHHIAHGMMRLPDGKMSSRTGNVVSGESLLAELKERALERAKESRADDPDKLAQDIAVAAIKYQILKQASGKNIVFDRDHALSLEGDSGPYLQYAFARTNAIAEKAREQGVEPKVDVSAVPSEVSRLLLKFPEAVALAAEKMEPHLLTNYLLALASAFNRWYAQEQILDGTPQAPHKLAVVAAARRTLKNGLWILGIPTPEKM